MSIWVDIIILAIIALFTFLGYKRGLVGVIFKIFSFVLAIILSFILYKPVSTYIIEKTTIDDKIEASVVQFIEGKKEEENSSNKEQKANDSTPKVLQNYINQYVEGASQTAKETIASSVSKDITRAIIHIATLILLFIVIHLLLLAAKTLSDTITNLPIIKQFDKLGGTIYGIIESFLILYIALALISLFMPVSNQNTLIQAINSSFLGNFLYQNNLLLIILF